MKHKSFFTGSTVIEVLIATVVVAFALTALAMLMTNNVKNSAEADYREAAAGIVQDTMEKLRQRKSTEGWSTFSTDPYSGTGCNASTTMYNTTFFVTCSAPPPASDQYIITVTVCWPYSGTSCVGPMSTSAVQRFYNN